MFPFSSRFRWITSGRQGHLIAAYRSRPQPKKDHLLEARIHSLSRLGTIRLVAVIMLSLTAIATAVAAVGRILPTLDEADPFLTRTAAVSATFAGVLTIAVFVLTYILGLLEIDILAAQAFGHQNRK